MSKYIEADKAKNGIMRFANEYGEIVGMFVNDFNILFERCAVDVQEVVRCKDCKHADLFYPYCTIWEAAIDGDGYCYKGEKDE